MNNWDKAFWILFIILEAAVIAVSAYAYTHIGVVLGFGIILVALIKVGEHVMSRKFSKEVDDNRQHIARVTNWMTRQHEFAQGMKNVHDHRFHRFDKKQAETIEKMEIMERQLAGKLFELENRLNMVSKIVIGQRKSSPVPKPAASRVRGPLEKHVDDVWEDVKSVIRAQDYSISTLSRGVKNTIKSLDNGGIVLFSEITGKERLIRKNELEPFWDIMKRKRSLNFLRDIENPKLIRLGSIIISFLARLPYVEYDTNPRVLYLMPEETHPMGTLKVRQRG